MPRDTEPTELELLDAKLRAARQLVDALERAREAAKTALDSNLAPRGCDRAVDGITCSPSMWRHVCLVCGVLFRRCGRHGGERGASDELAKHQWREHRVDESEGGSL